MFIKDGEDIYSVLKSEHNFRGRGSGITKLKVRNLRTGSVQEKTYRSNQKLEEVDALRKTVQYLYSDGSVATFMDPDSFEQFEIPFKSISASIKFLKEGEKVIVLFIEEKPVSVELPATVELKVAETEPATKGDTATNAMKKAKMETGLEVDVPLFVKNGDVLKINTESGTYVSRA